MSTYLDEQHDLEYLFDLSPDLICVAGYDGYFKKMNPAVSVTLGYTNEELFSKPIYDFIYSEDKEFTVKRCECVSVGEPLLNFENRYVAKSGEIVWLSWTSVLIERDQTVFAIAKNISWKKEAADYRLIRNQLAADESNQKRRLPAFPTDSYGELRNTVGINKRYGMENMCSPSDQAWICNFDELIKKYTGKIEINLSLLSNEMAMSERQLYRRVKTIVGMTPNQYICIIRLQIACDAIKTGKFRTIAELSYAAGFETPGYFSKLFRKVYGYHISELLKSKIII